MRQAQPDLPSWWWIVDDVLANLPISPEAVDPSEEQDSRLGEADEDFAKVDYGYGAIQQEADASSGDQNDGNPVNDNISLRQRVQALVAASVARYLLKAKECALRLSAVQLATFQADRCHSWIQLSRI